MKWLGWLVLAVSMLCACGGPAPVEGVQNGWNFQVTRTSGVNGTMHFPNGKSMPVRVFNKVEFNEEITKAEKGVALESSRRVAKGEHHELNFQSGQMEGKDFVQPGTVFRATFGEGAGRLYDGAGEVRDEDLADAVGGALNAPLWPQGKLEAGQSWSFEGQDAAQRLEVLDARGGRIDLKVEKIGNDPYSGLRTAYIRGNLKVSIELGEGVLVDLDGKVEIDLPTALNIPFMMKFEGRLSGNGTLRDDQGRTLDYALEGDGAYLQICKPASTVITALGGTVPKDGAGSPQPADSQQQAAQPVDTGSKQAAAPKKSAPMAGGFQTVRFQRSAEPRENAFTFLMPQGWLVQGGITRVDPTAQGGPAQSIEAKLDIAIKKDPQGTVLLRRLPDVYYIDPKHMPAAQMGLIPYGSNYQGMLVLPCQGAARFLTDMLFPYLHPGAAGVQLVDARQLPRLAQRFDEAARIMLGGFAAQFKPTYDAAVVNIEYTEGGVRYREVLLSVIENRGTIAGGQWVNRETSQFRAPAAEFKSWLPIVSTVSGSIQLNPQWVAREVQGQIQRGGTVTKTYQEIQRIGKEIADHRQQTNAEIHNDMFLTLTGQEEYIDPYTGRTQVDTDGYRHRWVHENGEVILSNQDDFDPNIAINGGWKQSQIRPRTGRPLTHAE